LISLQLRFDNPSISLIALAPKIDTSLSPEVTGTVILTPSLPSSYLESGEQ